MKEPIFQKIKDFIKDEIENKKYQEGDKIPTEMELSVFFNTSRQTVNKALRDLVLEGIVTRFPRSGSFISKKTPQTSIMTLKDIAEEIKTRGNTYSNELLLLEEIKADQHITKILQVVQDQVVYHSKMVHKENGVPVRYDERYVKPSIVPEYLHQDFKTITPSHYLQAACPVKKAENIIEAVIPNAKLRNYLDIEKTDACILISRIVTSLEGVASFSKLYYPSKRYKLNSIIKNI